MLNSLGILFVIVVLITEVEASHSPIVNETRHAAAVLADWRVEEFATHITIMLFLICVIMLRIIYQRLHGYTTWIPESFVLLVAGSLFGAILRTASLSISWTLTPNLFFTYLLPPIVLDSAYAMYNRTITDYMCAIMLFAVVGTILNFILIALFMYGLYLTGAFGSMSIMFDLKSFLLFSSFITAVDPVAVLATFQDIGVNLGLYYMVFGESLFNDAVTVVLYQVISSFAGLKEITGHHIFYAGLSFFTVSFGGLTIGFVIGILTCFLTRVESPLGSGVVLILGYFSYILGDCLGWSGIISMITCGLIQTAYAFHNISRVQGVVVRRVTKVAAEISEAVIFLFIGLEIVARDFEWQTGFCLWALIACLLARTIVILILANLFNQGSEYQSKISATEQVILIYGGLRGAVCFCLAVLIKPHYFIHDGEYKRHMYITATLFIILFTIIAMGMTIKPLVGWLHVPMRKEQTLSLFQQLHEHILDEALSAVETIIGKKGRNVVRDMFYDIDDRYIRRILQRDPETHDQKIVQLYEKIALKLHYATMQPAKSELHLNHLPEPIKMRFTASKFSTANEHASLHGSTDILQGNMPKSFNQTRISELISSNEPIDDASSSISLSRPHNVNPWVCCRRFTRTITADSTELDGAYATDCTSIQSLDTLNMRRYFRSSRYTSMSGPGKRLPEFFDYFIELLMSKTMLATKMERQAIPTHKNADETNGLQPATTLVMGQPRRKRIRLRPWDVLLCCSTSVDPSSLASEYNTTPSPLSNILADYLLTRDELQQPSQSSYWKMDQSKARQSRLDL
ncbi:hypothetical protein EG68_03531 [Paragonimus skrjabini miyazakii]|uniref:Sodium/hydrogen exchanger n=1 Tax=Paragonimus skrjabini miyazakii TaxID=59628 RepID=A0A8S9Z6W5_9TREM|nr:hypothetical protein EG68_03531 [Paragonimus skrjabini miyazakii]